MQAYWDNLPSMKIVPFQSPTVVPKCAYLHVFLHLAV